MSVSAAGSMQPEVMRAYRACINCRRRKSKCEFNSANGDPPCRRCLREHRDCVLSPPSARRKRAWSGEDDTDDSGRITDANENTLIESVRGVQDTIRNHSPNLSQIDPGRLPISPWLASSAGTSYFERDLTASTQASSYTDIQSRPAAINTHQVQTDTHSATLEETIAAARLHNTADAIGILAEVANSSQGLDHTAGAERVHTDFMPPMAQLNPQQQTQAVQHRNSFVAIKFKPLDDGLISLDTIHKLFENYERNFHPFFPFVSRSALVKENLPAFSVQEPHLFAAILTVASLDLITTPNAFEPCHDHMQNLVLSLVNGGGGGVEAVEALLLLAEWVSHWTATSTAVGRGEEDKVVWMYTGTAVRLGYFLDLDRTTFNHENNTEDASSIARRRLAWAACYMCDRNVSVRLGKGFWSRGPGPMTGLKAHDFPSLQPIGSGDDDYATIMQANLELTQLFSNAHDILYSRKGRGWKLIIEGDYIKYIDDFRSSIATWHKSWGTLTCSPRLKASLLLTYEFLRLYVNAFAYQATISRSIMSDVATPAARYCRLPVISAATPDARFIYESVEAAKSLLTTLNNFVDPEQSLRYMPSRFYLFIIYSAVFLYKAWFTGTMTPNEKRGVRRMIQDTIDRLQRASVSRYHMGSKYSQLLHLLWRATATGDNNSTTIPSPEARRGAFSWLDLDEVENFATRANTRANSVPDSPIGDFGDFMDESGNALNMALFTDYRWLSDDNSHMIF